MWKNIFNSKKLFSNVFRNTSRVYTSIYNEIGSLRTPSILVGANGIGGGNFGSYIDIDAKITNNTILDITSNSKDESLVTDFSFTIAYETTGFSQTSRGVTIDSCYSVIVDFWYFFPANGNYDVNYCGAYVEVKYNGGVIFNTRGTTTAIIGGDLADSDYKDAYTTTSKRAAKAPPHSPNYWTMFLTSNTRREFSFDTAGTVEVVYHFDFRGGWNPYSSGLSGVCNVTSLKATNNITRDIYATVIEQVDPTIN